MKSATALGLVALTGLAACDLTENIVSGVTSTYFETPSGLEDAVKATYARLHNFYAQEIHMTMTELGTDIWVKGADGSHKHFNDYTTPLNPTAGYVGQLWNDSYVSINTANAVITRGPNTAGMNEELRTRRIAEARFLRALFYFNLVRTYGDVHLTLEETVGVETEARRTPAAEVYQAIIEDLTFAEQNLPPTQPQDGRATRGAAQHLLSLVYLTRAASGDLERALEKANAVINSGTYQLVSDWFSLYDINNQKNSEVVFSVQFTNDPLTRGAGNKFHLYFLPEYDVLPGMHRVLHYGRPWKRLRPTEKLLRLYDRNSDTRFWDSFQTVWFATRADDARGIAVGDTAIFIPHVKTSALPARYHGKPYRIFTEPENFWDPKTTPYGSEYEYRYFPAFTKWQDPTRLTVNAEESQRNFPMMRLAETYLLAAEALVRLGRPADAVPYLNTIRERAALPGQVEAMRITAADVNLDFVLDERGRELAGEGHRWFTLQRNGKLVDWVKAHNLDGAPNIQAFHNLRPIPQTQIDRTANSDGTPFGQNPGYQ